MNNHLRTKLESTGANYVSGEEQDKSFFITFGYPSIDGETAVKVVKIAEKFGYKSKIRATIDRIIITFKPNK
jgi:hypothetical protein